MKRTTVKWFGTLLLATLLLMMSGQKALAASVPDTGQTKCYNNTVEIACPSPGQAFYGQDAHYNLHKRSYTKLDNNGNALSAAASSWVMVRDNVTGLIWENKTDDDSLHDGSKTFTWCDTNRTTNGGNPGTCGTGTGDAATDTEAFINALNSDNYSGHNDWRIPTVKELNTLINSSRTQPAIDTDCLPNTNPVLSGYWSSTTLALNTNKAWYVDFTWGIITSDNKSGSSYSYGVRAVRGGQQSKSLTDNGDGTVMDSITGLMWQKATAPGTFTWEQALAYVVTLNSTGFAGYTDWRLPDRNELQSLVDYTRYSPAIDPLVAADTVADDYYWSSTTDAYKTSRAWLVYSYNGYVGYNGKFSGNYVRVVRLGQSAEKFLYASFSNSGIWKYSGAGTNWTQTTASNPQLLVTVGADLYGTFEGLGIWKFNGTGWTQLTTSIPDLLVTSGVNLYGAFADAGIWQWNGTDWTQTTASNPQKIVASTSDLYGAFEGLGIWKFQGTGWTQLTTSIPDLLVTSGVKLYGAFADAGIWLWNGEAWTQATSTTPQMIVSNNTTLYGAFEAQGIWAWDGASTWTKISTENPTQMVASGTELYASFAGTGIRKWDGTAWTMISGNEPIRMVVGE